MLALIPSIFTIIRLSVLAAALLYLGQPAHAEKTLTIASPLGEKVISLDEDPEIAISYTPSGIKLTFVNLGISTVCIEDPSSSGFCRLQAYDGGIPSGPGGPSTPKDMDPPSVVAGDTQVALTWSAPADDGGDEITGYRIQIASGGTLNWATLVSDTGNTNTRYTATGLVNGESYRFRVAAINGVGLGTFSPASATVVPADSQSGDTYAQACNSVAANIQCEFFNQGDLQSTNLAYFDIKNGKILSIPFDVPTESEADGRVKYFSFSKADGYSFITWYSYEAGGALTDPSAANLCEKGSAIAESSILWTTDPDDVYRCPIYGDSVVFVNFKFERISDGALAAFPSLKLELQ